MGMALVRRDPRPILKLLSEDDMTTLRASYDSLTLLAELNWDRLLYGVTIAVALVAGAAFGNYFL